MGTTGKAKQAIRERVWSRLEAAGAVEPGVAGRIPDFQGAGLAAERLASLPVWSRAKVLKVVPDRPQQPVRQRALEEGKLVYMAAPKLAAPDPFYVLDPATLTRPAAETAVREVAARSAPLIGVDAMRPIDLVVLGTVAVNKQGARLGKGAGYSDIELGLLTEAGLVTEQTTICTTVHELQVVEEELPEQRHDFRVDVIVTPELVIWCGQPKRPAGLDWDSLSAEQVAAIPVLARRTTGPE